MTTKQLDQVDKILQQYNINFKRSDFIEIESDQNTSRIPAKTILQIIGLKEDKGHQIFIEKLNQINKYEFQNVFKSEVEYNV